MLPPCEAPKRITLLGCQLAQLRQTFKHQTGAGFGSVLRAPVCSTVCRQMLSGLVSAALAGELWQAALMLVGVSCRLQLILTACCTLSAGWPCTPCAMAMHAQWPSCGSASCTSCACSSGTCSAPCRAWPPGARRQQPAPRRRGLTLAATTRQAVVPQAARLDLQGLLGRGLMLLAAQGALMG